METFLQQARRTFPVLLVTGARQVGKSTLLESMREPERQSITLDDPSLLELARRDAALFLQRFPPPVLIDEVQYAPQLLPHIKILVDRLRRPDLFWLTGSQPFHLMRGVSESLAGRAAVVRLQGFSERERLLRAADGIFDPDPDRVKQRLSDLPPPNLRDLYHQIWMGSFPAVVLGAPENRNLYLSSYVQTYLQRDLRDLARVGDESTFLRFLRSAAARTGQFLNFTDLSRDVDVSPATAKSWLSILTTSGLVHLIEPWHTNMTKRMVKAPKLFFLDTGLAAWLTGWSSAETLESGAMAGAFLETWVASELLKSWWHAGQTPPLYVWRDRDGAEIDLVIAKDGRLHPLEVKKSAQPGLDAIRSFRALTRSGQRPGIGGVICLSQHHMPITEEAWAIPITAL
jgi:predicted AAA+ superfamily ATPase